MKVLIAYGTTEGHTRTICERVAEQVRREGHEATLIDTASTPDNLDASSFDSAIIAGSLHMEKHQTPLSHFVREHRAALRSMPTAFLSVSMTAALDDDESQTAARKCMKTFTDETGWEPTVSTPVAGALLFTKYDFFKRMMLKMISKKQGGPTDTSQDYVFTDWAKLDPSSRAFFKRSELKFETMCPIIP